MGSGNSIIKVENVTINLNQYKCADRGLILPLINEYTWPLWTRGLLYFLGLLYFFLGIAIIADIFMCAIEKITSKVQVIKIPDPNDPTGKNVIDKEVKVWNDTVANLTLMALGSSSPEILLSVIEICGNQFMAGDLGPGTIVGSAAYNLLVISGICILAIDSPGVRRIKNYKVFMTTAAWSAFAYIWLYLVLVIISPNEVTLWEAIVTLLCFPFLVVSSYMAEKNFFFKVEKPADEPEMKQLVDLTSWQRKKLFEGQSVKADLVLEYLKELGERTDITDEEKSQLVAVKILSQKEKNPLHYRINGVRKLTGSKRNEPELPAHLQKILDGAQTIKENENSVLIQQKPIKDLSENNTKSVVEFSVSSYAVLENEGICHMSIERYGKTDTEVSFRVETIDGTAEAGSDYYKIDEIKTMARNQTYMPLDVIIIDDNQWEPDETFFVKISSIDGQDTVKLGSKAICMVTIINDDEPGEVEFKEPVYVVKESIGVFEVLVERKNGADGEVSVHYKTSDINARAGKDYEGQEGVLDFKHGEQNKILNIKINDDKSAEKDESFSIELFMPQGGVKLGRVWKCVVTIINDDNLNSMISRWVNLVDADLDAFSVVKKGYKEQFFEAMNVNGGDVQSATAFDYFMHFLAFPWKVLFAFVPPPHMLGGWLCFFCSLFVIGILTAMVGDMAAIFGCIVGLKDSVTAITFVAMGTSLPDTFASKIAAKNEKTADNAIGNVTGSNSVNVFLGLGLPWVIATIYWTSKGLPFTVKAGALTFSVAVYTCCSVVCLLILFMRRYMKVFGRGELGGPKGSKYFTAFICFSLWLIYILLSSLQAYNYF